VVSERPAAAFVLLTEDTSKKADETLKGVTRHLLRAVHERLRTHRLRFEPAEEGERPMLAANRWKSAGARDEPKIRELCRSIATKLGRAKSGVPWFVLFHYDGDRVWSQRYPCDNADKFGQRIRAGVRHVLATPPPRPMPPKGGAGPREGAAARPADEVDFLLRRLVEVTPFYSMETWLFQNFEAAKKLCQQNCGGLHVPLLEAWQRGQPRLDEVPQPKEALCFRDHGNAELAGPGFPADDLYLAETSFHATVERLRQSPDLVEALERTELG
jgi:hypothetical protein